MIDELLDNPTGKIIISVILGLGLATVFRKVCQGQNCVVFQSPDLKEVEKHYYKVDEDCFKYTPYASACEKKKSD